MRDPSVAGPGPPVHADAFLGRNKVRRSVQAGFAAVGRAERGQKGCRGALAVGAQDLRHRKGGPGQIQGGQGPPHAVQAQIHVKKALALQMGQHFLKVLKRCAHARHTTRKRFVCQRGAPWIAIILSSGNVIIRSVPICFLPCAPHHEQPLSAVLHGFGSEGRRSTSFQLEGSGMNDSAVHSDGLGGNVGAFIRCESDGQSHTVFRLSQASQGDGCGFIFQEFR